MQYTAGIALIIILAYNYIQHYLKQRQINFLRFYENIQENTLVEANSMLNKMLAEFGDNPETKLGEEITVILSQNTTYVILTYLDNNDHNDTRKFEFQNSINFRKNEGWKYIRIY